MHVRRALLLFAIVLGLAAIATAISQPPRERETGDGGRSGARPTATPNPAPAGGLPSVQVRFPASERPVRRRLEVGRAATVSVAVAQPGEVSLPELGLTSYAEPLTPARFEVLAEEPARVGVWLTPAGASSRRRAGTLVIEAPER